MSHWFVVARVAVALNVLLLLGLIAVWGRNYLELRSKHVGGLLLFAVLLLGENALALYVYQFDATLHAWFASQVPDVAWFAMMGLQVLETIGLAVLLWITLD
jgi:hypothetical protein